jgi:hypothetical protein
MIQLSKSGVIGDDSGLDALAAEFAAQKTFKIRNFIEASFLAELSQEIANSHFYARTDVTQVGKHFAQELTMDENMTVHKLRILLNDAKLWKVIRRLTGCEEIQCFYGRMYQMRTGEGHYDTWHDDVDGKRMVGMSINFSPRPYEGGVFELRELPSQKILRNLPNTGLGDAIFFRIDPNLEHKVTVMEGTDPKIAFAGWFQNAPKFGDLMRETFQQ